jgi:hypothetical protein
MAVSNESPPRESVKPAIRKFTPTGPGEYERGSISWDDAVHQRRRIAPAATAPMSRLAIAASGSGPPNFGGQAAAMPSGDHLSVTMRSWGTATPKTLFITRCAAKQLTLASLLAPRLFRQFREIRFKDGQRTLEVAEQVHGIAGIPAGPRPNVGDQSLLPRHNLATARYAQAGCLNFHELYGMRHIGLPRCTGGSARVSQPPMPGMTPLSAMKYITPLGDSFLSRVGPNVQTPVRFSGTIRMLHAFALLSRSGGTL